MVRKLSRRVQKGRMYIALGRTQAMCRHLGVSKTPQGFHWAITRCIVIKQNITQISIIFERPRQLSFKCFVGVRMLYGDLRQIDLVGLFRKFIGRCWTVDIWNVLFEYFLADRSQLYRYLFTGNRWASSRLTSAKNSCPWNSGPKLSSDLFALWSGAARWAEKESDSKNFFVHKFNKSEWKPSGYLKTTR